MVILTDILTGEEYILPTPDGGQVDIDILPSEPLTEEETKKWFEFHNKKCDTFDKWSTPSHKKKITQRIHRL